MSFSRLVFRYLGLGNFTADCGGGSGVGFGAEKIKIKHEGRVKIKYQSKTETFCFQIEQALDYKYVLI